MPLNSLWETRFALAEELYQFYGPEGENRISLMHLPALQAQRRACLALIGELVCLPLPRRAALLSSHAFKTQAEQAVAHYRSLLQQALEPGVPAMSER